MQNYTRKFLPTITLPKRRLNKELKSFFPRTWPAVEFGSHLRIGPAFCSRLVHEAFVERRVHRGRERKWSFRRHGMGAFAGRQTFRRRRRPFCTTPTQKMQHSQKRKNSQAAQKSILNYSSHATAATGISSNNGKDNKGTNLTSHRSINNMHISHLLFYQ